MIGKNSLTYYVVSGGAFFYAAATYAQVVAPVAIASPSYAVPAENGAYADIADLVTIAPMIVDAQIAQTTKVPAEQAVGVPQTLQRLLVTANVLALVRGAQGVTSQVKFLLDVPKDAKNKVPKLKKTRYFIMGNTVTGRPGEIRLVRPGALVAYSPANDVMVRAITQEAVQIDAPQTVTGIASAFYSPGTIVGDGETQIFLNTQNHQPMALSVTSKSGQPKTWSASTSEVIGESAAAPKRFTLLWYRLACGLPRDLAAELVETADSAAAASAQADYKFVVDQLGPCGRSR
jgi:hypothetical protein